MQIIPKNLPTSEFLVFKLNERSFFELKKALPSLAGIYISQSNVEHDFSHWLQDPGTNYSTNAIWYLEDYRAWAIGLQEDLGSAKNLVFTQDDVAGPQGATNWYYEDNRPIESNDILVDSYVESGT